MSLANTQSCLGDIAKKEKDVLLEEKHIKQLETFNTADSVGNDRYVFDIKGNQYRLVALIIFKVRTVFILFIGTHKEYDEIKADKITFKK